MTAMVHTARVAYSGSDRLDVTRKSGREGLAFAPSWTLLGPVLRARRAVELKHLEGEMLCESINRGDGGEAGLPVVNFELDALEREQREAWERYVVGYLAEMRASYRANRPAWDALLAREVVTLCCYCTDPEHCHRTLLARDILPKLGATYGGER
jgi:hypothetical protein